MIGIFTKHVWQPCIYVNQTNLNGKPRKNWGAKRGGKQKYGVDMADPDPPLESPLSAPA